MSADGTIALIDGALADYWVSKDAMRWSPESSDAREVAPVTVVGGTFAGGSHGIPPQAPVACTVRDYPLFTAEMVENCVVPSGSLGIPVLPPGTVLITGPVEWGFDISRAIEAMAELGRAASRAAAVMRGAVWLDDCKGARCRECNPAGNQLPLRGKYKPGPKAARMTRRRR